LLTSLACSYNEINSLDLSAVPMLTQLFCHTNQLTELDIRPLKRLKTLKFDSDKTRLIQRPDQNF
jgi:Leucine-rich repeat (LRR) protein